MTHAINQILWSFPMSYFPRQLRYYQRRETRFTGITCTIPLWWCFCLSVCCICHALIEKATWLLDVKLCTACAFVRQISCLFLIVDSLFKTLHRSMAILQQTIDEVWSNSHRRHFWCNEPKIDRKDFIVGSQTYCWIAFTCLVAYHFVKIITKQHVWNPIYVIMG